MKLLASTLAVLLCASAYAQRDTDWAVYGGNAMGQRYSPLTQINRTNVTKLRMAWTFPAGDAGAVQTHPLIAGRRMFVYSPTQVVHALDAATGKPLWTFDSGIHTGQPARGFAYWKSSDGAHDVLLAQTLYAVWALDPATGKPVTTFGSAGRIDLREGLGDSSPKGTVAITTPGTIYKDVIILGFRTGETAPSPHGDIRAYNVHTGALVWSFHTIPHPGDSGYETWPKDAWKTTGGANNWAGGVLDAKRGIFYAPTGSAVSDFYGADRLGDDLYANSLLALDAATGKLLWHFQAVHHDMWDRDFPAPPVLVTLRRNGKSIDAIAQATKHGQVFVFDRVTGEPLFPVEEKPFPASSVPGEVASKTQPISTGIEPFARQRLTPDMLTNRTPAAHAWAAKEFAQFVSDGQFVPFRIDKQTVVFPGFDGGAEWGGDAVDPASGVMFLNANDIAWTGGLTAAKRGSEGANTYNAQCAVCHGADRNGQARVFPSLVASQLSADQMATVVHEGRGRMPGFPNITGDALTQLLGYVRAGDLSPRSDKVEAGAASTAAYQFTGYKKFLDPDGYPAVAPPWGTLNALDLNTGKYLWRVPLGEYPELHDGTTGSENYGGPVVTASGLLFIGATNFDHTLRCFDARTGGLLWTYDLPFAGRATPAIYMVDGKEYLVIAASNGHLPKAKQGAAYLAFALP